MRRVQLDINISIRRNIVVIIVDNLFPQRCDVVGLRGLCDGIILIKIVLRRRICTRGGRIKSKRPGVEMETGIDLEDLNPFPKSAPDGFQGFFGAPITLGSEEMTVTR
jgi:hypothetical protein